MTGRILHPDGRVRTFGYQLNHLASDCYLNGSMTCVSCHDPHTQTYRDEQFRPLEGRFEDRLQRRAALRAAPRPLQVPLSTLTAAHAGSHYSVTTLVGLPFR